MEKPINEYQFKLVPNNGLYKTIYELKQNFAEEYSCPQAVYIQPGFTIALFKMSEFYEQKILIAAKKIIGALPFYKIDLECFESEPTHSICISSKGKPAIMKTIKDLKKLQKFMSKSMGDKPFFISEPKLILANKLLPWQYEKAWQKYQALHFKATMFVDNIVLMKKITGAGRYKEYRKFFLQSADIIEPRETLF